MEENKTTKKDFKQLASQALPKWEILRRHIRRQILGGEFVPGDILPSEQVLCEQFGVARSTVRHALDQLEKEGIIQRIKGKGTFVGNFQSSNRQMKGIDVFCLIMPEVRRDVYPILVNGFSEGASEINHQVMVATTRNDIYRQGDIMLHILDQKMKGVALVPMFEKPTPPHHIRQLQTNGIPVVLCNRPVEGVSAPLVTWDWEEIGRIAARFFLNRGHDTIGYYANVDHPMTRAHIQGMQQVLAETGKTVHPNNILLASLSDNEETKKEIIQKRLRESDPPTAILCVDDKEAENVFWSAHDMGLEIPEDLAIIGFGPHIRDGLFRKRLSSVTMNAFELGKKAVKLLAEMQSGKRAITNDIILQEELSFWAGNTA